MDIKKLYMTTKEASEYLGVAERTIRKWCALQRIPHTLKFGRIWLINKKALTDWLKEQERDIHPMWHIPKFVRVGEDEINGVHTFKIAERRTTRSRRLY